MGILRHRIGAINVTHDLSSTVSAAVILSSTDTTITNIAHILEVYIMLVINFKSHGIPLTVLFSGSCYYHSIL